MRHSTEIGQNLQKRSILIYIQLNWRNWSVFHRKNEFLVWVHISIFECTVVLVLFIFNIPISRVAVRMEKSVWNLNKTKHISVKCNLIFRNKEENIFLSVSLIEAITFIFRHSISISNNLFSFRKLFLLNHFWNFVTVHSIPNDWAYSKEQSLFYELKINWNRTRFI